MNGRQDVSAMEMLWCWRCRAIVPMLDETEFAELDAVYAACTQAVKDYRRERDVSLAETPTDALYVPVVEAYQRLTGAVGFGVNEIRRHRRSAVGPPCPACGKPYRTPKANLCAACGHRRFPSQSA